MGGEREQWVDLAKAVGILAVVVAHAIPKDFLLWRIINQFHMPLFYFF